MADQEIAATFKDLIYLVSCAVNSVVPNPARIETMDLDSVLAEASRHKLDAAVAIALSSAGVKFDQAAVALAKAIRRAAAFDSAYTEIREELEKAEIWYVPLKGAVIKDYYPHYGMRQMSDYDILIDPERADDVRTIMIDHDYTVASFGKGKEDIYQKQPVLNVEMHRCLFGVEQSPILSSYYRNIKDRLIRKEGFEYSFSLENLYLYLLAHEYKHYSSGGTGLRSVLDIYVFLKRFGVSLDMEYIRTEAKKLKIAEFERANRNLSLNLFGNKSLNSEEEQMLAYIASSGTYGTIKHHVDNEVARKGGGTKGKLNYIADRLFLPKEQVQAYYPFFYRHKLLLPFLPVYRLWKAVTHWKRIQNELISLRNISDRNDEKA